LNSSGSGALSTDERILFKQYSRRRLFLFGYAFTAAAIVSSIFLESDLFVVDDYLKVLLSAGVAIIIAAKWRNDSLANLKSINKLGLFIGVLLLIVAIFAVIVEAGDGDDVAAVVLGSFLIVNGMA
jgi:hypothetical protein